MKNATIPIAITANGIPTPRPIFAPDESPDGAGAGVAVGVFVPVEPGWVVDVVALEVVVIAVACEKSERSELCHITGNPSP